jgi:L-lysine exporter family protein LysE/ArgO
VDPPAAFLSGLLFGLSLIVAIGAQNVYVLRQGALRSHVLTVVVICTVSDVILIAAGVAGVGAMVGGRAVLLGVVRGVGALMLLGYGALAARRALSASGGSRTHAGGAGGSWRAVIAATLGFTWLNPAVYLDTLVLLGSVASAHADSRWWFGAGAATASAGWFAGLGFGARLLTPLLSRRQAGRTLDAFVALVMALTALRTLAL